jgi:Flp pilus assembly protein TadD
MTDPDPHPTDEQLAALMAALPKAAPSPDPEFLTRLREQSLAAFAAAPPPAAPSPRRKRTMLPIGFRWVAATAAATLALGIGFAVWVGSRTDPVPMPPPADEPFAVAATLTDDGRIGTVTDAQGVVAVKPVLRERWSPVQPRLVLKPGDWLRTDSRGANAVAFKLVKSTAAVVGPHSTVELVKADEIRLLAGEIEITAPADAAVELHGPDKQTVSVKGKQLFRVEKDQLVRVEKEPLWLQGFRGTTANESIGSLVATIDGRDVPLAVGFHRVTVDIRDQIARTTIEESFVNATAGTLEGVFYFPLPQDASISGFGMWIGDNLVEADIVEKQRAREIYETILRERRDPGLLEWAGGNIFKARIFPIPAHAEKRIRITYTQVLPLQGNRYRYSYGLQSELLRQHPLRELKIDVEIQSAAPLKGVSSPTHAARVAKTEHAGHVEFSAQEYTPTRDFEAVVEVDGGRPDVVVIPHRRGDDGYFMVQLTPPGGANDGDRPLVGDGDPLHLLLLADTSASMDKGQRATQNALIGSILGALTPRDTVNVAACDVNCDWVFEKPVGATPDNVAAIRGALARRVSLGWTDLDKAFASVMKMTDATTHVVYLGDGIVTTGNADPVAFAKRLQRLDAGKGGTFHAVALGSSYEPAVLKAIAAIGGGSVRRVSGERGPQVTALDLLTEITAPTLRDVKVEFAGLRTARVYPETLPNVAAGTQQILLGRYLPENADQTGEIVVTGMAGGKPVRYASKVVLKDAEAGNAFIPRLWARMHLDALLERGASEAVKQEVIALSEEFNIITPYTSLLVLESDADRERFAVRRRFRMRDGETFFADGRENATFALKQKQMKLAGDYRTALRRALLAQLRTLGRDARMFQPPGPGYYEYSKLGEVKDVKRGDRDYFFLDGLNDADGVASYPAEVDGQLGVPDSLTLPGVLPLVDVTKQAGERDEAPREPGHGYADSAPDDDTKKQLFGYSVGEFGRFRADDSAAFDAIRTGGRLSKLGYAANPYLYTQPPQRLWLSSLFPSLAPAAEVKETPSAWPAAALALSRGLLRTDRLAKQKGGVVVARQSDAFGGSGDDVSSRVARLELVSPTAWFGRTTPDGGQVTVSWCDAKDCGAYTTAFQLGRVRGSTARDLQRPPLDLDDHSVAPLHVSYAEYTPSIETVAKDRELLILKHKTQPAYETRVLVDTNRRVVLSTESRHNGKATGATKYEDFVEIGGVWWARRGETLDEKGRRRSLTTQTVTGLSADEFTDRMAQELAGKSKVLFLRQPLPKVTEAKAAVAAGRATFDDRAVLVLHFASTQQWTRAREHLEACERLAAGKSGMRWLTNEFLHAGRRQEELRTRYLDDAAALVAAADPDVRANDDFLAGFLLQQAYQILLPNETLALADAVEPVYRRQPARLQAVKKWRGWRVGYLQQADQPDKALALAKELAVEYPRDLDSQYRYAQHLATSGDYAGAYAWLNRVLADTSWEPAAAASLRGLFAGSLETQGRFRELAAYCADWRNRTPDDAPDARYLSALVRCDRADEAEALARQWMRDAQVPGALSAAAASRFGAAVGLALGQGHNLYTSRIRELWYAPLAEAALYCARHDRTAAVAGVVQNGQFQQSDEGRAVRKTLAGMLVKDVGTLSAEQIDSFATWLAGDAETTREDWKAVAAGLRKRWEAEKAPAARYLFGRTLARVLGGLDAEEALAFLRAQWKTGPREYAVLYANELFNALLARKWAADSEDEAFELLDKLTAAENPAADLFRRVAALHRLTDTMLAARYQARMAAVEHQEKLTRVELRAKQDECTRLARAGFADRLRKEAARHANPFAGWVTAERLWLDVALERDPKEVAADCFAFLDAAPPAPRPADDGSSVGAELAHALRERYLVTVENLAARKGADPALADRLSRYIDRQIQDHPEDGLWREEKYRLLIVLDRGKELETALRQWTAAADSDGRWKLALGTLLAEHGKVAEAIALFEAVEAADELTAADYRRLADWYLAADRRERYEKARTAMYATTDEDRLGRRVGIHLRPWQDGSERLPAQLDPELLKVFAALFEKSAAPQNYLWRLQAYYQASHDFRLLAVLPDGVVGHSAGAVYPFLQGMSGVLGEVRDEAAADELVARIAKVRAAAKTDVDRRALDLLELLVERRAAELANQPGPHAGKALAALARGFKHAWSPGEPRLMVDFLADLGAIPHPALAEEQRRQLNELARDGAAGSFDRLRMALRVAQTLSRYGRGDDAADRVQVALKEFAEANGGVLPTSANTALDWLVSYRESARTYDRGEKLLLAELAHPAHAQQKEWLTQRLNGLYLKALQNKGEVSLGTGAVLYKALETRLLGELAAPGQDHRYGALNQLTEAYLLAYTLKIDGTADDLREFAFKKLPPLLKDQSGYYAQIVRTVSGTVRAVCGLRDGIAFLLDRLENEPAWLRYTNQDDWNQNGYMIGQWRNELNALGDLEPRLLKVVLAELRRGLAARDPRTCPFAYAGPTYFWSEKADAFAKAAEDVLAEKKDSGAAAEFIAEYLFRGLNRRDRAIAVLFAARERKRLSEAGERQLVEYLHVANRYAESVPLLLPLVAAHPDEIGYRTQLMHAYFCTAKEPELIALLNRTDAHFHEKGRWTESALAALGASCQENHLFARAAAYFDELIPRLQRSQPNRGIGSYALSSTYMGAAYAYTRLGNTREAVDRAGGAVVSCGPDREQRQRALNHLVQALADAPDLPAYAAELDADTLQSAVVRRAIGLAYMRKNDHARALPQLQLASELQPDDAATYEALLTCYDRLSDADGAIQQLLRAVELSRRDIKLYAQLGQRFAALGRQAEAERAYTSAVEMLPNESESHALLADVREKQSRWPEAAAHWERVAAIRSLEPTGLLRLAAAQIECNDWDAAAKTLRTLRTQTWPPRFGDVSQQARELEKKLEDRSKR